MTRLGSTPAGTLRARASARIIVTWERPRARLWCERVPFMRICIRVEAGSVRRPPPSAPRPPPPAPSPFPSRHSCFRLDSPPLRASAPEACDLPLFPARARSRLE